MPDAPRTPEEPELTPAAAERIFRQIVADAGLRQPDEVQPRESGGITCLWYEEKLAVIIEDEEAPDDGPGR